MSRFVTYAIDRDEGMVYSRVGSEIAVPVLQYDRIGRGGDFRQPFEYELEKTPVHTLAYYWPNLKWTKKIPVEIKNLHREFWGMKALKTDGR